VKFLRFIEIAFITDKRGASLRDRIHPDVSSQRVVESPLDSILEIVTWFFMQWSWGAIVTLWIAFTFALDQFTNTGPLALDAFRVYYEAGENLLNGQTIYNGIEGWIYLYPPLLAQMLMPVAAWGDLELAKTLWLGVNIGLLVATLHMLTRYIPSQYHKLLWVSPVFFVPVWQALYIGQVTVIMLVLLAGVWVAVRENKPFLAGSLLALAAWIKVFPALLVVYFLWKRDWKVIRGVIIAGVALALLQVLISGVTPMIEFFSVLFNLFVSGQPAATYENLSIFGFTSRLFQPNVHVIPLFMSETLFSVTRILLTVGLFTIAAYAIFRSELVEDPAERDWRFDVEYALVLLTILMVGSTLWISGLPPLLLVSVLILRNTPHYRWMTAPRGIWLIAAILLVAYQPLLVMLTLTGRPVGALTLSLGFFGILTLWGLMVGLLLIRHPIRYTLPTAIKSPAPIVAAIGGEAESVTVTVDDTPTIQ
jgi:hypothetical protein